MAKKRSLLQKLIFSLVVLVLFLAVAEIAARLVDRQTHWSQWLGKPQQMPPVPRRSPELFNPASIDQAMIVPTRRRLSNEPGQASHTGDKTSPLTAEDFSESGKRVFVLGGSAAYGAGVSAEETFAFHLQEKLPRATVINGAKNGLDSEEVRLNLDAIAGEFAPDLFVIYSGNNEWESWWWWGPDLPLSDTIKNQMAHSMAAVYLLGGLRVWRMRRVFFEGARVDFNPHAGCRLPRTINEKNLSFWQPIRDSYLDYFEYNMREMVKRAHTAGAEIVLCEVPYRLELCPAVFLPQTQQTLDLYREGRRLKKQGRFWEAAASFAQAREQMAGDLGAMQSINERIRRIGREEGALVAPLQDYLLNLDENPLAIDALFTDFCHLKAEGHQHVAEALLPFVRVGLNDGD